LMGAPESSTPKATGTVSRVSTYLIMNGTKVAGVYIILKEQGGEGRNWVLVAGAALALGAQTVEAIVIAAIDRFFGGQSESRQ
jgi:drug/metabolite transporter (DMT)-like permease